MVKRLSQKIYFYGALDLIEKKTGEEPLKLFKKALSNVKPAVEVKVEELVVQLTKFQLRLDPTDVKV